MTPLLVDSAANCRLTIYFIYLTFFNLPRPATAATATA